MFFKEMISMNKNNITIKSFKWDYKINIELVIGESYTFFS